MKEIHPEFNSLGTRQQFTHTVADLDLSFKTVTDPLKFLNMTEGLESYACTSLGAPNQHLQFGIVASLENGLLEVWSPATEKIAAILFKVLPGGIDISRPYWYQKTPAKVSEQIYFTRYELAKKLHEHMGMKVQSQKEFSLRRNTTNHEQWGESENIAGVESYNEKGKVFLIGQFEFKPD